MTRKSAQILHNPKRRALRTLVVVGLETVGSQTEGNDTSSARTGIRPFVTGNTNNFESAFSAFARVTTSVRRQHENPARPPRPREPIQHENVVRPRANAVAIGGGLLRADDEIVDGQRFCTGKRVRSGFPTPRAANAYRRYPYEINAQQVCCGPAQGRGST